MKILLIGGTGFIGTYLYEDLCIRNTVDRTYAKSSIEGGTHYDVAQHSIDEIIKAQYDLVINNINPLSLSYQQVGKAIEELTAACKKYHSRLINISSLSADGQNKFNDSYSMKKHIADEIIMSEMQGYNYTILRFPQVFDYKGKAKKTQAGLYFLIDAIKKSEPISLFVNSGTMFRNYIPIDILISSVNYTMEKNISGLHNVYVPAHTSSLRNIINLFAEMNPNYDTTAMLQKGEKQGQTYYIPPVSEQFDEWSKSFRDLKYYLSKTFHEYQ